MPQRKARTFGCLISLMWITGITGATHSSGQPTGNQVAVNVPTRQFAFFGDANTGPGTFLHPAGLAVMPSGNILVTDTADDTVKVFDCKGKFQFAFGGTGSEHGNFKRPAAIAVAEDGSILVADAGNNRIQCFDRKGKFRFAFGGTGSEHGKFLGPSGVAVGRDGRIVVADTGNNYIQLFDRKGAFLFAFGSREQGDGTASPGRAKNWDFGYTAGRLNSPGALAVSRAGNILVAEPALSRIQVFDRSGKYRFALSGTALLPPGVSGHYPTAAHERSTLNGGLRCPAAIAVSKSDRIFVADGDLVQIFDNTGKYLYKLSDPASAELSATGIALGPSGEIIVLHVNGTTPHRVEVWR